MQKYPLLILIFRVNSQAGNFPETVLHAFNFWLLSVTIFFCDELSRYAYIVLIYHSLNQCQRVTEGTLYVFFESLFFPMSSGVLSQNLFLFLFCFC